MVEHLGRAPKTKEKGTRGGREGGERKGSKGVDVRELEDTSLAIGVSPESSDFLNRRDPGTERQAHVNCTQSAIGIR